MPGSMVDAMAAAQEALEAASGKDKKRTHTSVGMIIPHLVSSKSHTDDFKNWSYPRQVTLHLVESKGFDISMNVLIILNVVTMVFEADVGARCLDIVNDADCQTAKGRYFFLNSVFLGIYTIELCLRVFTYRRGFFDTSLNYLDLIVVVQGIITVLLESFVVEATENLPSLQMLKIFRSLRLMRGLRLMAFFPELSKLVQGFIGAMHAMFWGMVLIMILLLFFGILCVELVYPRTVEIYGDSSDEWCAVAFKSVWHVIVLYFQTLVAGDSWGQCIRPVILQYEWTAIIFIAALVCVQLGFTNLILAVVVDAAAAHREADANQRVVEKIQMEISAVNKLHSVIKACDKDESGEVTLQELRLGLAEEEQVAQIFKILDIGHDDLEDVFNLMDVDNSGTLSYDEFIRCLRKAELQDQRVQMMLLQLQVSQLQRCLVSDEERSHSKLGIFDSNHQLKTESGHVCKGSVRAPRVCTKRSRAGTNDTSVDQEYSYAPSSPSLREVMSNVSSGIIDREGVLEQKLGELALEMSKALSILNAVEDTLRRSLEQAQPNVHPSVPCFPLILAEDSNYQNRRPPSAALESKASAVTSAISTGRRSEATVSWALPEGGTCEI